MAQHLPPQPGRPWPYLLPQRICDNSEHKRRQAEKDQELAKMIKDIEMQSAARNHSVKETTKTFFENVASSGQSRVAKLKSERAKAEELHATDSRQLQERLSSTYHNLELLSGASELQEWCDSCGCIHTKDVLKDDQEQA